MSKVVWGAAVVGIALLVGGCNGSKPSAAPRPSSRPTSVASPSDDPTAVATATPVATASPTSVPTPTPTSTAAPAHTVLLSRKPVTAGGHLAPGYRITKRVNGGSCFSTSEAFGAAYRCSQDNLIYDPCWKYATAAPTVAVLCLTDPYSHDVTAMVITGSLEPLTDKGEPFGSDNPWGLKLSDGSTCAIYEGASSLVHDRRVNWGCTGKHEVLAGLHRTSHGLWTADTVDGSKDGPTMTVVSVVYGQA